MWIDETDTATAVTVNLRQVPLSCSPILSTRLGIPWDPFAYKYARTAGRILPPRLPG